jgi:hypothetical protein
MQKYGVSGETGSVGAWWDVIAEIPSQLHEALAALDEA